MDLLFGLILLVAGIVGLKLARPKAGKPRSFVGTNLEVPVTLAILGLIAVGIVLTITGVAALRS
jgi:hypothetical protein